MLYIQYCVYVAEREALAGACGGRPHFKWSRKQICNPNLSMRPRLPTAKAEGVRSARRVSLSLMVSLSQPHGLHAHDARFIHAPPTHVQRASPPLLARRLAPPPCPSHDTILRTGTHRPRWHMVRYIIKAASRRTERESSEPREDAMGFAWVGPTYSGATTQARSAGSDNSQRRRAASPRCAP